MNILRSTVRKEGVMRTKIIGLSVPLLVLSMFCSDLSLAGSAHKVESHGVALHVLQEATLEQLHPGKYRMRATEITVEPGHVLSTSTYPGPSMAYIFEELSSQWNMAYRMNIELVKVQ